MTVSEFITILRLNCGDVALLSQDKWSGDGATQSFRTTERPIMNSAYQAYVYVGSWGQKQETTNYTVDKDSGIISFTEPPASGSASGAPNNQNIRLDYKYAFLRDDEWLQIIKEVLALWRRKIWTYDTDEATFNTVKDQDEYDMDDISSDIIWITQMEYKKSTEANWTPIAYGGRRNWLYEPELNKVIIKYVFDNADYDIRVLYIKAITVPSVVGDTFAPIDVYHPPIIKKCLARYWQRFANYKLKDTGAIVKEMTYHPATEIMNQARLIDAEADRELGLVKPRYPNQVIQILSEGRKR